MFTQEYNIFTQRYETFCGMRRYSGVYILGMKYVVLLTKL